MFRFICLLVGLLLTTPAWAVPSVTEGSGPKGKSFTITIAQGDTTDSKALAVEGVCSVRARIAGSDVVEVWGVNSTSAAATSGTQVGSDITSSTTVPIVEKVGTFFWKVRGDSSATGGSQVQIDCSPLTSTGSGGGATTTLFAGLGSIDEATTPLVVVRDCATDACIAGGGSIWKTKEWDGDSWENVDDSGSVTGLTNPLTTTLNADSQAITNPLRVGDRNYYANSDAELASALTALGDGIGQNEQTGGTIWLEGGQYSFGATRALCGDGTAALGRNGLRIVGVGGGYGPANASQYPNAGTVISWTGGADPMFTVGACAFELEGVALDGNGAATNGVDFLDSSGAPIKTWFRGVSMYGFTGFAIQGAQGGQFDESTFEHVYIEQSAGAIQIADSQSIGVTLGPKFNVTNMTGTGFLIDVAEGSVLIKDSYCGLVANDQKCIHFAETANQLRIENVQMEGPAYSGLMFIDADDGGTNQNFRELIAHDIQFIIDHPSTAGVGTALDFFGRGNVVWEDNNYVDTNWGVIANTLAVTIDRDTGASTNRLTARVANNFFNNGVTMSVFPGRWLPTIGTDVDVQSPIYSAATLPGACAWWEVARETDAATGEQLFACESGAWVRQNKFPTLNTPNLSIASNEDFYIDLDENNDSGLSAEDFIIRNGANTSLFIVNENGDASILDELTVNGADPSVFVGPINFGSIATVQGSVSFYGGDTVAPNFNLITLAPPTTGGAYTFRLPPSTGITDGYCVKANGTTGATTWGTCGTGGSFDATAQDSLTWSDGLNANNVWTMAVTGTDPVFTFSNGLVDLSTPFTVASITTDPTPNPTIAFEDSNATDGDVNGQITLDCTDTGSGAEDCDVTLSQQEAGTLRSFMTADADDELEIGGSAQNRVVVTTDGTGDAELVLPANAVSSAEMTNVGTAGTYTNATVTVDAAGRVTSASNGSGGSSKACIRANGTRSLPNDANENALFSSPTNGRITLTSGVYEVSGMIGITGMSATSGNGNIDLVGAGTVTAEDWMVHMVGHDNSTPLAIGIAQNGGVFQAQDSGTLVVAGGTGTGLFIQIRGMFDATAGGTAIPSFRQAAASAATLASGSYICYERVGDTGAASFGGTWD